MRETNYHNTNPDECIHGYSPRERGKRIRNDRVPHPVFHSGDVRRPEQRCYVDEEGIVRHVASDADPEGLKNVGLWFTLEGIVDLTWVQNPDNGQRASEEKRGRRGTVAKKLTYVTCPVATQRSIL